MLAIVVAWGFVPQLACFLPEPMLTEAERDCCEKMAGECGGTNMIHACCRTVVRTDVGIASKEVRNVMLQFAAAGEAPDDIVPAPLFSFSRELSLEGDHAPPDKPSGSSLILRI